MQGTDRGGGAGPRRAPGAAPTSRAAPQLLRRTVGGVLLLLAVAAPGGASELFDSLFSRAHPDALWSLVSTCVNREAAGSYCACPGFARSCCGDPSTPDAAVLWAETPEFVALRDLKACGCPADFVAGLAIPRTRITGIEDPKRPDAIWPFAWGVARARIPDELEIGLVINPAVARSQNQMHVHMLRLKPGARAALDAAAASGRLEQPALATVIRIATIDRVFADAAARVGADAMGMHGILVARARDRGFLMALTDGSSPQKLTINGCRAAAAGPS